ncbi:MAG: hypothetical protein MMC33_010748, partial [Icmadophila ericetorum]|nr:hypothetical protein [Icmadophila ericetorum]
LAEPDDTYLQVDINSDLGEDPRHGSRLEILRKLVARHRKLFSDSPGLIANPTTAREQRDLNRVRQTTAPGTTPRRARTERRTTPAGVPSRPRRIYVPPQRPIGNAGRPVQSLVEARRTRARV